MITVHAPALMEQGRSQTIESWIKAVPDARIEQLGWVLYWRGVARGVCEPALGRTDFESAYRCFEAQRDYPGALLACAARLASFTLERTDNNGAEAWADRCETLYIGHNENLPPSIESAVIECLTINPQISPDHGIWIRTEARARRLMQASTDQRVVLRAANYSLIFNVMHGDFMTARSCLELLRGFAGKTSAPPFLRILSEMNSSILAWQEAQHAEAHAHIDHALAMAEASGVHVLDAFLYLQRAYTALSEGDVD